MTRLSLDNLDTIAATASVPTYAQRSLSAGIVHFGVGNFHRAHQSVYLDDLFNAGLDHDWAVIGAGTRTEDLKMKSALENQDFLSTVVEQDASAARARVTSVMIGMITPGETAQVVRQLADPKIRIVSLTVTEGGYYIDSTTQQFDPTHPEILADARNPENCRTVFGLIYLGLRARKDAGIAAFTVVSCDNIPGNGRVTRDAVVGLARLIDSEMAEWIVANVAFPSGMVDRITPATSDRERAIVSREFGIEDAAPVFCEEFRQWVLEDHFPAGRPALEKVGVQFVPDVEPFELMKIRILNGGHATIAYPAALMDIHFVHDAMNDPLIRQFLHRVTCDEIIPVVPPVPDTDLADYCRLIEQRFANPRIGDTISRLCLDGSNRQPKFILPSLRDRLRDNASIEGLALVSAFWCRYCCGTTDAGNVIAPNDPNWDRLTARARLSKDNPANWLAMDDIYGSLGQDSRFLEAFAAALTMVWREGTRATLQAYLTEPGGRY